MRTEILNISGITSEDCAETVMRVIQTIDGVSNVSVSFPDGRAVMQFDQEAAATREVQAALAKAGYEAKSTQSKQSSCGGCCGKCGG